MARARSTPAPARSAARTSGGPRGVYVQSPKSDIFVALLGVAVGAMLLGVILLILVLNRYGFSTKVSAVAPATSSAVSIVSIESTAPALVESLA